MLSLINSIENWLIKMWFYVRITFYFRPYYSVKNNIKNFTLDLDKSNVFNSDIIPTLGKIVAYKHEDDFGGVQWLTPNWNKSMPSYDTEYPWGGKLEADLSNNDPGMVVPTNKGLSFGCVGIAEDKKYLHSLIYSNFSIGPSFAVDFVGKTSSQHGVITAFWVASRDGIFEMDAIEYMGEWGNACTVTLHHGDDYSNKNHWRSKHNKIKHWKYKPTEQKYHYRIVNDVDRNISKFYLNGYLIRKFHRTSTAPCYIVCSTGVWKHTNSSFITEASLDSILVYKYGNR